MRTIVFNNIIELIYANQGHVTEQPTNNGIKYTLRGQKDIPILSIYQNARKIELFVNGELFASDSLLHRAMPFDPTYDQRQQLYKIRRALKGEDVSYKLTPNFSAKCRGKYGATPKQVDALQAAWLKAHNTNAQMCTRLGHSH